MDDLNGGAGDKQFPWGSLVSRALHPIQVAMLEASVRIGLPISPVDVFHMFDGEYALALVGYHAKALADRGVIEVVDTEPVRGTLRHLYPVVPESRWP
jgi:hypothetical protein